MTVWLFGRRQVVWTAVLGVVGAGLCFAPLFHLLGYEFSAVVGTAAGVGSGALAVGIARDARERGVSVGVGTLFGRAWVCGSATLVLPFLFIVLNGLRVKNCDMLEGVAFYAAIPCVSVTYGAGIGTFCGVATRTPRRGLDLWLAWIAATTAFTVFGVVCEPPKFAYGALFGFVPGPLYEEEVSVTGTLLVSRAFSLAATGAFLSFAWAAHDPASQRLRLRRFSWREPGRRVPVALFVLVLCALGIAWANAGALGIRPTRRDIRRVLDGRFDTDRFSVYFETGAVSAPEIRLFAEDAEFRYDQLARFFGFGLRRRVRVYVFTSPKQKKRWIGAADTYLADPVNNELHLNHREFPHPVLKHELAHLFAGEFHPVMKVSPVIGLLEGVAVAAEWDEGRLTAHQWSRAMQDIGVLPKATRIMSPFGFWSESSSRAYTASGSFCRWLIETYGAERLAQVYPTGNFAREYGKPLRQLNDEWEAFLRTAPMSAADLREAKRRFQRRSLFQKTCAHVIANLESEARKRFAGRDYDGARAVYERILTFEPGNADARWRVVQTRIAAGQWRFARDAAQRLSDDATADELLRLLAREAVADADWRLGETGRAERGFDSVRRADYSPDVNRRAIVKRDVLRLKPQTQRLVRGYFDEPRSETLLYRLRELTLSDPSWALGRYLLGRALADAEQWEDAAKALTESERLGLPDRNFGAESARLRGIACYRLRRFAAADRAFADAAALVDREGERLELADWRERCKWTMRQRRDARPSLGSTRGRASDG